jgi:hypothetical protein
MQDWNAILTLMVEQHIRAFLKEIVNPCQGYEADIDQLKNHGANKGWFNY